MTRGRLEAGVRPGVNFERPMLLLLLQLLLKPGARSRGIEDGGGPLGIGRGVNVVIPPVVEVAPPEPCPLYAIPCVTPHPTIDNTTTINREGTTGKGRILLFLVGGFYGTALAKQQKEAYNYLLIFILM